MVRCMIRTWPWDNYLLNPAWYCTTHLGSETDSRHLCVCLCVCVRARARGCKCMSKMPKDDRRVFNCMWVHMSLSVFDSLSFMSCLCVYLSASVCEQLSTEYMSKPHYLLLACMSWSSCFLSLVGGLCSRWSQQKPSSIDLVVRVILGLVWGCLTWLNRLGWVLHHLP